MSAPSPNPFESPTASDPVVDVPDASAPSPVKPRTPMIFGVTAIVFGALSVLSGIIGLVATAAMQGMNLQQPGMPTGPVAMAYIWIVAVVGLAASGVLLAAGIFLVRHKKRGVPLFNLYAWTSLALMVANVVYTLLTFSSVLDQMAAANPDLASPEMRSVMMGSMIFGAFLPLVWCVYPVLGMVMLNRPNVKQSLA